MDDLRHASATVAGRARHVRIVAARIAPYAGSLSGARSDPDALPSDDTPADLDTDGRAAFWLTLDAINFGSGWFPSLRKRGRHSGYNTIALAWREQHAAHGPFTPSRLTELDPAAVARILGQEPTHELMGLYARSLNDLGTRIETDHTGDFLAPIDAANGSAVALARTLGSWNCFADVSRYGELTVPFLKRAQIVAADLDRAGVGRFTDLDRLTMFADNLVPHVLRLDGILDFDPELIRRIDAEQLIEHGSPEEVEIRACAVHAVELLVTALGDPFTAAAVDQLLWNRGQQPRYKASPRHRSRCTAY